MSVFLVACGEEQDDTERDQTYGEEANEESADPLHVYTTLFPLEDFANRIGGEHVEVENIIPPGTDAHTFEPTAQKMISVAEGDLFVYNGAGFEGFADMIDDVLDGENVEILEAVNGIDLIDFDHEHSHDHSHEEDEHGHDEGHDHSHEEDEHGHDEGHDHGHEEDEHDHGDKDPHVWLDPIRAIDLAENIKEALVELRPEGKENFEENFEDLKAELEILDEEFQEMADNKGQDTIIVSHAGYGYWDERYGIHQIGIAGLSPSNEPSIQQVQEAIEFAEENNINYVMFEQNIPTKVAETVREQIGAEDLWLHNLEALTEEDSEKDEDYFSLMRRNIDMLHSALQ